MEIAHAASDQTFLGPLPHTRKPGMRTGFCRTTLGLIVSGLVGISGSVVHAQNFPLRPVKIITDVGTGGTYDIFARALAEETSANAGTRALSSSRTPAAMPSSEAAHARKSPPDGHTLCIMSNQELVANEFLYKKLPYSRDSFSPITNLFYNTQVIVVSASLGVRFSGRPGCAGQGEAGDTELRCPGHFPASVL